MRNKMAAQPTVVNNQKLRTASELTQERRLMATNTFFLDGSSVGRMGDGVALDAGRLNTKAPTSTKKTTSRPGDASSFTAYLGSHALQNGNTFANGTTQNAGKRVNPPACVLTPAAIPDRPSPYITGTTTAVKATTVARSGSDYIRERLACQKQKGEQHNQNELGPSKFVDNTNTHPALNKFNLANTKNIAASGDLPARVGVVFPSTSIGCGIGQVYPLVNHTHSVTNPRTQTGVLARPSKSKIPVFAVPSQDYPVARSLPATLPNCYTGKNTVGVFSRGGIIPANHPKYVERHHGNDLSTMVNGRKPVPTRYRIPAGTPAHVKINDPLGPRTPNM